LFSYDPYASAAPVSSKASSSTAGVLRAGVDIVVVFWVSATRLTAHIRLSQSACVLSDHTTNSCSNRSMMGGCCRDAESWPKGTGDTQWPLNGTLNLFLQTTDLGKKLNWKHYIMCIMFKWHNSIYTTCSVLHCN